MKKIILISILLLLLLLGCEEKFDEPLGPYPTDKEGIIQRFIAKGWEAYNDGDYELAYARFDSAVKLDASNSSVYVGLGFSNMQLGSEDASRFTMARSSFGFVPTLEGGSPIVEVQKGDVYWGWITPDSTLFGLGVDPDNIPILGVLEPTVHFVPDTASTASEQDLEIKRITDNTVVTNVTKSGGNLYLPGPGDRFEIDYAYFDGEISKVLALALAGYAQTAQIQGKMAQIEKEERKQKELLDAVIYAKAVLEYYGEEGSLRTDTLEIPNYIDPAITTRNVRILLAQSYFYYGFFYNCMWELWKLDPTLVDYFDPESETFERDLQEKLEDLL